MDTLAGVASGAGTVCLHAGRRRGAADVYGGTPITTFPVNAHTDMFVEAKTGVFIAAVPTVEGSFVRMNYYVQNRGGAPADGDKYTLGDVVTVKSGAPTRDGYDFKGWSMNRSGAGVLLQAGDTFQAQGDVTLYAQWKQHTQPVTVRIYEVDTPLGGYLITLRPAFGFGFYPLTETSTPGEYTSNDIPKVQASYDVFMNFYGTPSSSLPWAR